MTTKTEDTKAPSWDEPAKPEGHWDRHFNPYRKARTAVARELVDVVLQEVIFAQDQGQPRTRKRKQSDLETLGKQIDTIISNLIYFHLTSPGTPIAISRRDGDLGTKSRYKPSFITKALSSLVDILSMEGLGYLEATTGQWRSSGHGSNRSTIIASGRLQVLIETNGLKPYDFTKEAMEELIILKNPKAQGKPSLLDYHDNEDTIAMRQELDQINQWIAQAALEYFPDGSEKGYVDTDETRLYRVFCNGDWGQHGRLYGGFWINLTKRQRSENLVINGNHIVALDYKSTIARILYGLEGIEPPWDDAYLVPGYEDCREGIKKVFSAMAFASKPLIKLPRGSASKLPEGTTVDQVVEAIRLHHRPIAHYFCCGFGLKATYVESQILIKVLEALRDLGIVALPIHDCILVEDQHLVIAKEAMELMFQEVLGIKGVVTIENNHIDHQSGRTIDIPRSIRDLGYQVEQGSLCTLD